MLADDVSRMDEKLELASKQAPAGEHDVDSIGDKIAMLRGDLRKIKTMAKRSKVMMYVRWALLGSAIVVGGTLGIERFPLLTVILAELPSAISYFVLTVIWSRLNEEIDDRRLDLDEKLGILENR